MNLLMVAAAIVSICRIHTKKHRKEDNVLSFYILSNPYQMALCIVKMKMKTIIRAIQKAPNMTLEMRKFGFSSFTNITNSYDTLG